MRLPHVDRAPPVGRLVGEPHLEAQARNLGERVYRLVTEVAPQLVDRRLGVRQVPEDEPDQHAATRPLRPAAWRSAPSAPAERRPPRARSRPGTSGAPHAEAEAPSR